MATQSNWLVATLGLLVLAVICCCVEQSSLEYAKLNMDFINSCMKDSEFNEQCQFLTCECINGGSCVPDGCLCTDEWTGRDCSLPKDLTATYFVGFLDNYRRRNSRLVHVLTYSMPAETLVQIMRLGSPTEPLEGELKPFDYTTLELPIEDPALASLEIAPDCAIEVIALNSEQGCLDAFSAIPVLTNTSQEYVAMSIRNNFHKPANDRSEIFIIATRDNTLVKIAMSVNGNIMGKDYSYTSDDAHREYESRVNRYETLMISSSDDLTGTRIWSSFGLAVFSGHECGVVTVGGMEKSAKCNHLEEQMPPVSLWGNEYVVMPFIGRTAPSMVKLVASQDNTFLEIKCVTIHDSVVVLSKTLTLKLTKSKEIFIPRDASCLIHANSSLQVAHFSSSRGNEDIGAASMVLIPDVNKTVGNTSFLCMDTYDHRFHHFIIFAIKATSKLDDLILDEKVLNLEDTTHRIIDFGSGKKFHIIALTLTHGYHVLQHSARNHVFGLVVYGFSRDAAYSYSIGYHHGQNCHPSQ